MLEIHSLARLADRAGGGGAGEGPRLGLPRPGAPGTTPVPTSRGHQAGISAQPDAMGHRTTGEGLTGERWWPGQQDGDPNARWTGQPLKGFGRHSLWQHLPSGGACPAAGGGGQKALAGGTETPPHAALILHFHGETSPAVLIAERSGWALPGAARAAWIAPRDGPRPPPFCGCQRGPYILGQQC